MPEIVLVRQEAAQITEQDAAVARRVIFGIVDGLGNKGRKQWRRLWSRIMGLEQAVFESQERFEDFESFRTWLKVGAQFVDWFPGPKGGVIPVPRSISYAKLEQGAMEQFHGSAVDFLRTEHAGRTLWKHLNQRQRIEMIEGILGGFNE